MVNPFKAVTSVITVVAFLALTAIAASLYGGGEAQQARVENNFFLRNTKLAMDYLFVGAQGIVDIGVGKEYAGSQATSTSIMSGEQAGAIENLGAVIKEEWESGGDTAVQPLSTADFSKFWEWRPTDEGVDIVFKDKDGGERVLPVPYKFWKRVN